MTRKGQRLEWSLPHKDEKTNSKICECRFLIKDTPPSVHLTWQEALPANSDGDREDICQNTCKTEEILEGKEMQKGQLWLLNYVHTETPVTAVEDSSWEFK